MVQIANKLSLAHRSRIDIIANILRAAQDGARKTHIMYKCNLSFKQLHTYLDFLIERKLIRYTPGGGGSNASGTYQTTNRGRSFIQAYGNMRALMSSTEQEPEDSGSLR